MAAFIAPTPMHIPTIDEAIREAQRERDAAEWDGDLRFADFWQRQIDWLKEAFSRTRLATFE